MNDNKVKIEYTTIPLEKSLGKTFPSKDGLPTHSVNNATHHRCPLKRCHEKREAWRKTFILILILATFFASKVLFGWIAFTADNESNDEDQYLWIEEPGFNDAETESTSFPTLPKCEPNIKWEGPSELLLDAKNTSGLVFKVKGFSASGNVTIRQDPQLKDFINITNHIYMDEESLQKKIDVKIGYADNDYLITVETPSFVFPPKKRNCVLVDTIITIPNTTDIFRSLSVAFPNGWITTDSLDNIDFAYVNLKTVNGHIYVDDLSVANVDISAANGHVDGVFVVGESLEVRSINGPVSINVTPNPSSDFIFAGFSSINGNFNITVEELMEHHKIELKGRTVNGGIVATMPNTYEGDFLVASVTGSVTVEGEGITFKKNTKNYKEGYKKGGNEDDEERHCKHANLFFDDDDDDDDHKNSNVTLKVVAGTSELYFV